MSQNSKKTSESKQDLINSSALNFNKDIISTSQTSKNKTNKEVFEELFCTNSNNIIKKLNFNNQEKKYYEKNQNSNKNIENQDKDIKILKRSLTDKIKRLEPELDETDEKIDDNNKKDLIPKKEIRIKRYYF